MVGVPRGAVFLLAPGVQQHLSDREKSYEASTTTTPEKIIYFNISKALSTFHDSHTLNVQNRRNPRS